MLPNKNMRHFHHAVQSALLSTAFCISAAYADVVSIDADTTVTSGYSGTAENPLTVNFNGGKVKPDFTAAKIRLLGDYATFAGVGGNDIAISLNVSNKNNAWRGFQLGGIEAKTAGDCDYRLVGHDDPGVWNSNSDVKSMAVITNSVTWGHTGDIVVENMRLRVQGDSKANMVNALPYGPGHGGLVLRTRAAALAQYGIVGLLDLYQRSQCINWLDASDGGMVTNCLMSANQSATLTFGTGDVAGYVKGPIGGNVFVEKAGSAALTLHDCSMPNLTAKDGSVSVVGAADVGAFTVKPDVSVAVADGGTLTASSVGIATPDPVTDESAYFFGKKDGVEQDGSIAKVIGLAGAAGTASVSIAAGGTLEFGGASDATVERVVFSNAGMLRKVGAGDCTVSCAASHTLGGTVHVADGSLAFAGVGNTNEWWKFVVTRVSNTSGYLHFGQFGLFDKDGNKLWSSISATADASVPALANGRASYSSAWTYDGTPAKMFTGNYYDMVKVSGLAAQNDQSANPFEVAFRIPVGANPAAYFSFSSTDGYGPAEFHVETSPSGADGTWTTVGSGTWSPSEKYYYWHGDGTWGGICGMPWQIEGNAPASVNVSGATLRVDSGATLDIAGATGGISAIEVDWTSMGGAIRGLSIEANGALRLLNVPQGTKVTGTALLRMVDAEGVSNVKTWTVYVNGIEKPCTPQVDAEGNFSLVPCGLTVILR